MTDELDVSIFLTAIQRAKKYKTKLAERDEMIAKMIEVGNRLEQFAGLTGKSHADYAIADWHLLLRKIDEEQDEKH